MVTHPQISAANSAGHFISVPSAAAQQHIAKEARSPLPTCPIQNRLRNTHPAPYLFQTVERPAVPRCRGMKDGFRKSFFLLSVLLLSSFTSSMRAARLAASVWRWFRLSQTVSPELNQRQNKYLRGFQMYNFGLGSRGHIAHCKIPFRRGLSGDCC